MKMDRGTLLAAISLLTLSGKKSTLRLLRTTFELLSLRATRPVICAMPSLPAFACRLDYCGLLSAA